MEPDGSELIDGCLRGEKAAWDSFVDRYSKLVYWSIWKTLEKGGSADKEELCREAFQEFFRRMLEPARFQKLAGVTNVAKYLEVTARNLTLERFRRSGQMARFEIPETDQTHDAPSPEASPDESMLETERHAVLEDVLGALKPNERKCLELHYLDGHTHQEVGRMLGLPQDTVSTLIRRTKEKLRVTLKEKGLDS